jgi:hypothetical protein
MQFLQERQSIASTDTSRHEAWCDLCHVLLNVKEFIYVP